MHRELHPAPGAARGPPKAARFPLDPRWTQLEPAASKALFGDQSVAIIQTDAAVVGNQGAELNHADGLLFKEGPCGSSVRRAGKRSVRRDAVCFNA